VGDAVDTARTALAVRIAVLRDLADALARGDYHAAVRAELALPPAAVPPSVAAALRELRGATVDPAPERVVPSAEEWVPSVGDFGPVVAVPTRVCALCGSSWLGAGECPNPELHAGVADAG
jgi:hypothetical protein